MKKLIGFSMLLCASLAFADDFEGVIEQIDDTNKTITINGVAIKILPQTKIEEDSCWMPWDISKRFADLKVGDIVEVDLMHHNNMGAAKKVEIQCVRNRAY
ncbi:hypothetical protein BBW65_07325 [Helicobacter enhydrae]|uniref:DUF5666 domain-containing protein n=1 Tax=Helicobacter enhydrae TaxID=222136 RepID=A0A1B1U772_9HELI|nr:DUF5666 domain-containing protein [Helicobacter enhydrae]ANV98618.1 hypothetical protein BBW65_07325 [Helicobacter enhydrae]